MIGCLVLLVNCMLVVFNTQALLSFTSLIQTVPHLIYLGNQGSSPLSNGLRDHQRLSTQNKLLMMFLPREWIGIDTEK